MLPIKGLRRVIQGVHVFRLQVVYCHDKCKSISSDKHPTRVDPCPGDGILNNKLSQPNAIEHKNDEKSLQPETPSSLEEDLDPTTCGSPLTTHSTPITKPSRRNKEKIFLRNVGLKRKSTPDGTSLYDRLIDLSQSRRTEYFEMKSNFSRTSFDYFKQNYKFLQTWPAGEGRIGYDKDQGLKDRQPLKTVEDILFAWKTVAINFAFDRNDIFVREVIRAVRGATPMLSWEGIAKCMKYLAIIERRCIKKHLLDLIHTLDVESAKKLQGEFGKAEDSSIKNETKGKILELAFLWISVGTQLAGSRFHLGWSCQYTNAVTDFFVTENMFEGLSKEELVFVLFLLGVQRQPSTNLTKEKGNRNEPSVLPKFIYKKLLEFSLEMSLEEIGIVCNSLRKCNFFLRGENQDLVEFLCKTLAAMSKEEMAKHQTIVLNVFRLLKGVESTGFEKILENHKDTFFHLHPLVRVRLAEMMTSKSLKNYKPFIESFVQSIRKDLCHLRLKDLEKVCRVLFKFSFDRNKFIYQDIIASLDKHDILEDPRGGKMLVNICACLVKLQFMPNHVSDIMEVINSSQELREAQTESELVEAAVRAMFALSSCRKKDALYYKLMTREIEEYSYLQLGAIRNIGDMDFNIELDFPDYTGVRLDPELRRKFLAIRPKSEDSPLEPEILMKLKDMLGEYVYFDRLLPNSSKECIYFCIKYGAVTSLPSTFPGKGSLSSMVPNATLGRFIALVVPGRSKLHAYGKPNGDILHLIRQLGRIGYKVILVNPHAYMRRSDYLSELINSNSFIKRV